MNRGFVVLIPAFNASGTLPRLLDNLGHRFARERILVVNDGSTDRTGEIIASHGVRSIFLEKNLGKGRALAAGFHLLRDDDSVDAVLTMDADLQHDPEDISAFIDCRRETGANVVVGRRHMMGTGMPVSRRISNVVTSFLVSARTGCSIRDSQCGFRLIGREVLNRVTVESPGYEAETEFLLKACRAGFRVATVPVRTVYDGEGSHMTHWHTTQRFIQVLMKEF